MEILIAESPERHRPISVSPFKQFRFTCNERTNSCDSLYGASALGARRAITCLRVCNLIEHFVIRSRNYLNVYRRLYTDIYVQRVISNFHNSKLNYRHTFRND